MPKLPKPNAQSIANLKKIAAKTGKRLQQIPIDKIMEWDSRYCYSCAEAGNVTGLNLDKCELKDISFLTDFPRLTHLSLWSNQIADLSPLQELTKLTGLGLENNQVADLSPLQALTQLTSLSLLNNQVADISPLMALTQLKKLGLQNNQVADLSPLSALTQLTVMDLQKNQVADLSPLMALTKLTALGLQNNKVADLSPLSALTQLTELYLVDNKVADISPLMALTQLTGLGLSNNQVADISPLRALTQVTALGLQNNQVADLSPLMALTKLTTLWLQNNQVADISTLMALTKLNVLYLENNQISDLSPLMALTQLTYLDLQNNKVADLSPLMALTQLKEVYLSNNQVADISPLMALTQLTGLGLSNNQVADISPLRALTKLEHLYIDNNPIEKPPPEIAKQGIDAIRNYFKEIEKQSVMLLQSKLLLVGAGAVGKTSLMKKLKDSSFKIKPGIEPTTRGVDIIPWELPCSFADGKTAPVKLYYWDFGGQDIMYTTHQFFLTKRSLYIFVWEARLETDETDSFDYWLNIIRLLSDDSPVIIVMNKADVRNRAVDEASYRDKFKNIRAFFQVSCLTGKGLPELKEEIRDCLSSMKHLQDKLPKAWLDIRDALKKLNKDYISLDDYFAVCKKHGLDRERADFLSDYLHDLGTILHFRNDHLLENIVILNPEWATHAVYRIMDEKSILENKGRFHYDDLKNLWDKKKFPPEKHAQLLRLMERFELCFPVIDEKSMHIVPELLPAQKPALDFNRYDKPGILHFEYHYKFMPRGILSRFISRLYYYIHEDHFWKSGVELTLDGAYALVLSESLERKLSVSVCGGNKIELLTIARHHLEHIHRSLNMEKDKDYKEMIPCYCTPCRKESKPHLFQHEKLRRFTEKGITHAQCQESGEQVSIDLLLKGFAPPQEKTDLIELSKTLIETAARLQGRTKNIGDREDDRTGYIVDLLTARGYIVKDQTRRGSSLSGKAPGELDMLIETPDGAAVSIVEALILKKFDRTVIAQHFQKIFLYDPSGLENNYLLVYAESDDFLSLWRKYLEYLPTVELKYKLTSGPEEEPSHYADIKIARTKHNRNDRETAVYHLFINMTI